MTGDRRKETDYFNAFTILFLLCLHLFKYCDQSLSEKTLDLEKFKIARRQFLQDGYLDLPSPDPQ